jgi:hypothetical protein
VTILVDGMFGILNNVFKSIYERVLEVVDMKMIYDSMELQEFKMLVNVL